MRRWLIVLLITLAISTDATLHAANVNVTIKGEVSIGSGANGDANAFFAGSAVTGTAQTEEGGSITISVAGKSKPIVSGGTFQIADVAPGKHTLTASASGYTDTTKTIWVIDVVSVSVTYTNKEGQLRTVTSDGTSNSTNEVTLPYDKPVEGQPQQATCDISAVFNPDLAGNEMTDEERADMINYVGVGAMGQTAAPASGGAYESGKFILKGIKLRPRGNSSSEKSSAGPAPFKAVAGVGPSLQRSPTEELSGTVSSKDMSIRITCGTCSGGNCPAGSVDTGNGCFQMSVLLGWQSGIDARAGAIGQTPSPELTKLSGLKLSGAEGIGVKKENSAVRQTLSVTALADFVQINDYKYEIRFYHRNVIGQPDANGIYSPSGPPYQKVTVENPDSNPQANTHVVVTDSSKGEISDFVYTGSGWTLTKNGKVETVDEVYDSATTETIETRSIRDSSNALVSRVQTVYRDFPWMKRVKIREINDPDGKALTTRWSYYDQKSDQINYRQLKQVVYPNGYWERYEYSSRGPTKTVAQFLNAPVGARKTRARSH